MRGFDRASRWVLCAIVMGPVLSACALQQRPFPVLERPTQPVSGPRVSATLDRPLAVGDEFVLSVVLQEERSAIVQWSGGSQPVQRSSHQSLRGRARVLSVVDRAVRSLSLVVYASESSVSNEPTVSLVAPNTELVLDVSERGLQIRSSRGVARLPTETLRDLLEGTIPFENPSEMFGPEIQRRRGERWQVGIGVDELSISSSDARPAVRRPLVRYAELDWVGPHQGVASLKLSTWAYGAELTAVDAEGRPLRQRRAIERSVIVPTDVALPVSATSERVRVDRVEYRDLGELTSLNLSEVALVSIMQEQQRWTTLANYTPAARPLPTEARPSTSDPDATGSASPAAELDGERAVKSQGVLR